MADKKKLMESVYDLDHCDALHEDNPKVGVEQWTQERTMVRNRWSTSVVIGVFAAAFVLSGLLFMHFRVLKDQDDLLKFRTSFIGDRGHLIDQDVVSSGINNIIEYYVVASPDERLTIIDDFNKDLQIVKISQPHDEVCYVSELKKGSYVRPSDVIFGSQVEKDYVSQVYEASEKPLDDLTVLGVRGLDLCREVPVYWIRAISETDNPISATNFTTSVSSSEVRYRSKRNIRQCHTSCCWLVCCCDVHHFTWERVEHFTCNHVCRGCTAAYKSIIRKIC